MCVWGEGSGGESRGVVCGDEPKEALPTPAFSYISAGRERGSENRLLIIAGVLSLWARDLLGIHTVGSKRQARVASSGSPAPHRSHHRRAPSPPLLCLP